MNKTNPLYSFCCCALLSLLASCNNDSPYIISDEHIVLSTSMACEANSRAENYSLYDGRYKVTCFYDENRSQEYFNDCGHSTNGVSNWNNNNFHIWPRTDKLHFITIGNISEDQNDVAWDAVIAQDNRCRLEYGSTTGLGFNGNRYYVNFRQNNIYDDLIIATNYNETRRSTPVPLQFIHALAQVRIKLVNNTDFLDIYVDKIEITNVIDNACFHLPQSNSQYIANCWELQTSTDLGSINSADGLHRTGTWNSHDRYEAENAHKIKTIYPDTDDNFKKTGKVTHNTISTLNNNKPFYMFPHMVYGGTHKEVYDCNPSKIRFHVRIWDNQTGNWHNDALGQDGIIECSFFPPEHPDWEYGVGRSYTMAYTINGHGQISISANVAAFANEDWGISAN